MAPTALEVAFIGDQGRGAVAAVKWYRKAAEQGYARAQFSLGAMYANGRGVPRNDAAAEKWFQRWAKHKKAK